MLICIHDNVLSLHFNVDWGYFFLEQTLLVRYKVTFNFKLNLFSVLSAYEAMYLVL